MNDPIAVIGISLKYPQADTAAEFEHFLETGAALPAGTWRKRGALLNIENYNSLVGNVPLLSGVEYFDHHFFGIVKKEAVEMLPEMRLSLMLSVQAVYDAGYALAALRGCDCGMVIAASACDYYKLLPPGSSNSFLDTRIAMIGGKMSYYLNLTGPVFSVDSTCSSSLLAVAQAAGLLNSGQADLMLAGGIQLVMPLDRDNAHEVLLGGENAGLPYIPFDERAAGFVPGEGAGFVLLKRLSDAVRDRDHIYGVIRGSGFSGTAADRPSLYAPDGGSQSKAVLRAWKNAGVTADDITEIETHGAATALGDANEVRGLGICLKERTKDEPVLISSVKANVGHTSQAAGISGLLKVLLEFKNDTAYAIPDFRYPKKEIDFRAAHLQPLGENVRYAHDAKRIVGIDSYGLNGLNVHMVVENRPAEPAEPDQLDSLNHILKISGKTETAFYANAEAIAAAVQNRTVSLNDLIYTLNLGRDDFRYRTMLYFDTEDVLLEQLRSVKCTDAGQAHDNIRVQEAEKTGTDFSDCMGNQQKIAQKLYLSGYDIDFSDYYKDCAFRRVPTVSYCFDPVSCWVPVKKQPTEDAAETRQQVQADSAADRLKAIWKEVLESDEEIGEDESFFELGGNSMLGTMLIESVNAEFGSSVEIGDIYTHSTIREMAGLILNQSSADDAPAQTDDTAERLKAVWKEVLALDCDIAPEDSFFDLGGNFALADELADRLKEAFGAEADSNTIYEHPTLLQMSEYIKMK